MPLWIVEWSHDDGMDQHIHAASLTEDEVEATQALLEKRGAIDICIWRADVIPLSHKDLLDVINEDLPEEEHDAPSEDHPTQ